MQGNVADFLHQLRKRSASGLQHLSTPIGRCGGGVAYGAAGVVVLRLPIEFGAAAIAQNGVVLSAVLCSGCKGLRLLGAHSRGLEGKHEGRFDLARMDAKPLLLNRNVLHEVLPIEVEQGQIKPTGAKDHEAMIGAQLATCKLHEADVPAMGVKNE